MRKTRSVRKKPSFSVAKKCALHVPRELYILTSRHELEALRPYIRAPPQSRPSCSLASRQLPKVYLNLPRCEHVQDSCYADATGANPIRSDVRNGIKARKLTVTEGDITRGPGGSRLMVLISSQMKCKSLTNICTKYVCVRTKRKTIKELGVEAIDAKRKN